MDHLFSLKGKTALVTGGASGMGRMIAEGFLRAGARVVFTSRKADACAAAAEALAPLGPAEGLAADLANVEGANAFAKVLLDRGEPLHILVNNAGRTYGAPFATFPDHAWPSVMAVNVQVPFTLVRNLLPLLSADASSAAPSRVINIGSIAGAKVENIPAYSYAASKAALHHLSKILADELARAAVTVNTVLPGYFPTQMTSHIRGEEDALAGLVSRIPLGRLGAAEDIAGACIFLASPAAAYITGASLAVDGGLLGCD